MRHVFGSLVARIGLVFLLGLLVLQGVVAVALLWPDGRPTIFRRINFWDTSRTTIRLGIAQSATGWHRLSEWIVPRSPRGLC